MTRTEFLRNLAASVCASGACLAPFRAMAACSNAPRGAQSSDPLELLVNMADPPGGKLWQEAQPLISFQIRRALAALKPSFDIPNPEFGADYKNDYLYGRPSPNAQLYRKLAIALLCKAADTPNWGLNKLVKGPLAAKTVTQLINSPEAKRESYAVYDYIWGYRHLADYPGWIFAGYIATRGWDVKLANLAVDKRFMNAQNLAAVCDAEGTRRHLKLILYKLRRINPSARDRVAAVWESENSVVFRGAVADEKDWPPNLFAPTFDEFNPIAGPLNTALQQTRQDRQQIGSAPFQCYIFYTYHGEAVVNAVRTLGGQLGLTTGANPDNVEADNTDCRQSSSPW
jgi:hypothetical protein